MSTRLGVGDCITYAHISNHVVLRNLMSYVNYISKKSVAPRTPSSQEPSPALWPSPCSLRLCAHPPAHGGLWFSVTIMKAQGVLRENVAGDGQDMASHCRILGS